MSDTPPSQTDDARVLLGLETVARAEVLLPADAHVVGEPITVTKIRYPGISHAGLLATCRRGDLTRANLAALEAGKTWRELEAAS